MGIALSEAIVAVVIEFSRPKASGRVMPGNSTRLRVGKMGKSSSLAAVLNRVASISICSIVIITGCSVFKMK